MYEETYLRVLVPRTKNGNDPIIVKGTVQYKEVHLPFSSKKHLELLNKTLPDHLKREIQVVYPNQQ